MGKAFQNCAEPWMAEPKRHMDVPQGACFGRSIPQQGCAGGRGPSQGSTSEVFLQFISKRGLYAESF